MKRTQIYLSKEQEAVLKRLSQERGRSMAELIREAVDLAYLRSTTTKGALAVLVRTAGCWGKDAPAGQDFVEEQRRPGRWAERLEHLVESS